MTRVGVEIDGDLGTVLGKSEEEIERDLRLGGALRWYAEGRVSRRQAASLAGVSEVELADALGRMSAVVGESSGCAGAAGSAEDRRDRAAAPDFELALLGPPIVRRSRAGGGMVEADWRLRRAFETVAYLALAPGRRATKDELVEAVWPDAGAETIRKNFHPLLSEARRALRDPSAILFRQRSYRLNPERVWKVDVLEFERLAAAGRDLEIPRAARRSDLPGDGLAAGAEVDGGEVRALESWRRAWELYRGPLLGDLERIWIVPRREFLHREYLRVLRDVGRVARRLGLDTLALDAYRSALVEEPYEEASHLAMMELFARQGRRDLVLRQYSKLQEVLQRELGEEPSPRTQERYHRLMRKRETGP